MFARVAERCSIGHWATTARKNKSTKQPPVAVALGIVIFKLSRQISLNKHPLFRQTEKSETAILCFNNKSCC